MVRLPDWERRLSAYLASVRGRPHAYGDHDCILHGANAVQAQTGEDPAAQVRGRYRTHTGSIRALRRHGAGTVEATVDAVLLAIGPAQARRGDLVMADGSIGVCIGGDALFVGEEQGRPGLVRLPRAAWTLAWRVG